MLNWAAASERLCHISKVQVLRFLNCPAVDDVYGVGFFCDAYNGSVYLVANTEQYCLSSLREFQNRFGPTDPELFRWDIGNWKYPGGLFASSAPEQVEFDTAWEGYRKPLANLNDEHKQNKIEQVCLSVLSNLLQDGVFGTALKLKGFAVLGPDDRKETVLGKRFLLHA